MGLPDVGWWSADILFYCPLNVSELEKDVNLTRKATCTDDVHYIHASYFLFRYFTSGCIRENMQEENTANGNCVYHTGRGSGSRTEISLLGIQRRRSSTGCLSRHDSSVIPSFRFVQFVPKYLAGIWFTLNSNWMQNKIKITPLNWAWPGIIRADESHYSSKVKSSSARSVRSQRRDCHSRKALMLEADNHLGRFSG